MNTILKENLREDFYIRLFFDTKNGFYDAGTKRAFLDFSRTLPIKDENRSTLKQDAENFLINELKKLTEKELNNQENFDNFHRLTSENLMQIWDELSFGQAQKWINMTLKYWLLFGETKIKGIELNARYFHIPIDSFVQKGMFKEKNPKAWSKISDYQTYLNYQIKHREKKSKNYPIVDEFEFFNQYKTKN